MKFKILTVGKIKESFYREAIGEYVKRISRFANVEIVETEECKFNGDPNARQIEKIIQTEGESLLAKLEGYVAVTDINGKLTTSEALSKLITEAKQTDSVITFVIGGSNGLSQDVKNRADVSLSFGRITLPHQLFRVVLLEQIYRACCIEHNVKYHK